MYSATFQKIYMHVGVSMYSFVCTHLHMHVQVQKQLKANNASHTIMMNTNSLITFAV